MRTLYFGNDGEFDIRAMLTFGVSAKEKDDTIGYFGTGFKYAVAIILRLGGTISILTHGKRYEFTKATEIIRNQSFDCVKVNGADAGFTTRLGIGWQPWQAFRELYCNCKDENGVISTDLPNNETIIAVNCDEVYSAFVNKGIYFIDGDPDISNYSADIYFKPSQFIFYRGIAVQRLNKPAIFTYSVNEHLELTEDRTTKSDYYATYAIQKSVQLISDPVIMHRILTAPRDSYEAAIQFDPNYPTSDIFIKEAARLVKTGIGINDYAMKVLAKHKNKMGEWPEIELTKVQEIMLENAISFLQRMNIPVKQFPIKVVDGLGDGVMGRAANGVIYISPLPFNMGTKQVASTLMEEWVHLRHSCDDFSRTMQSWLFDKILSLGEEINGNPL